MSSNSKEEYELPTKSTQTLSLDEPGDLLTSQLPTVPRIGTDTALEERSHDASEAIENESSLPPVDTGIGAWSFVGKLHLLRATIIDVFRSCYLRAWWRP
jgi:hypothetical protein